MAMQFPKGKFISLVKVGEKGQIVIPRGRANCSAFSRATSFCSWPIKSAALRWSAWTI